VMGGQWYDANISLPGCDKNMPGQSTCVLGKLDIVSAFQVYGSYISDKINEEERLTL
ncbi:18882_t:CDS:2, partial [Entrophospora sp. SA101]